jgi:hypothetical protein
MAPSPFVQVQGGSDVRVPGSFRDQDGMKVERLLCRQKRTHLRGGLGGGQLSLSVHSPVHMATKPSTFPSLRASATNKM